MHNNLHPWTYCVVTSIGPTAAKALALPHNSRRLDIEKLPPMEKRLRTERQTTPDRRPPPPVRVQLTLERESFFDPRKGVVFGSDSDCCDILLDTNNSDGVSGVHFSLQFAWDVGPQPYVLLLKCFSKNGTRLGNEMVLWAGEQQCLESTKTNLIEAAGRYFHVDIIDWRDTEGQEIFYERWTQFVVEVDAQRPRKPPRTKERFGPTPFQPIGSVRYLMTRKLVHYEDLCQSLQISPHKSQRILQDLGLVCRPVKALDSELFLDLDDAAKFCARSEAGEGAAQKLRQAVTSLKAAPETPLQRIQLSFFRQPGDRHIGHVKAIQAASSNPSNSAKYQEVGSIYSGPFSAVRKMIDSTTGRMFAFKFVRLSKHAKVSKNIMNEVEKLPTLKHENIVHIYKIVKQGPDFEIRMDYFSDGNLENYVKKKGILKEHVCAIYIDQVLRALTYIHGRGIVHRDVKPSNILISSTDPIRVKLTDFGLMKDLIADADQEEVTFCGTPAFLAPETCYYKKDNIAKPGREVDIWALGVTLWFTFSGEYPFRTSSDDTFTIPIFDEAPDYRHLRAAFVVSNTGVRMLRDMFNAAPEERPTATNLRAHPWFKEQNVPQIGNNALSVEFASGKRADD